MFLNKTILRAVSILLIHSFLASGTGFAVSDTGDFSLAPPLATKPPCQIIYDRNSKSWDVVTGEATAGRSYPSFRNSWAIIDISFMIGQMLKLTRKHKIEQPLEILRMLIRRHIKARGGEQEILL